MRHPAALDAETLLAHQSWVRALARRLIDEPSEADDIAQETWLRAIEQPPRHASNLRAWFATLTRHFAWQERRRHERRVRREQIAALPEPLPSTAEIVERADLQRRVVEIVIALDEPYRSALLLRFFEDLEPVEIAKRLGVPNTTVRSWLHRAVQMVRDELDRRHEGQRQAWMATLAPIAQLAPMKPVVAGVLVMSPGIKVGAAGAALCAVAVVAFLTLTRADAPPPPSPSTVAQKATATPSVARETPPPAPIPPPEAKPARSETVATATAPRETPRAKAPARALLKGQLMGLVREYPWSAPILVESPLHLTAEVNARGEFALDVTELLDGDLCDEIELTADDPGYLPVRKTVSLIDRAGVLLSADGLPVVRISVQVARTTSTRVVDEHRQGVPHALIGAFRMSWGRTGRQPATMPIATTLSDDQGYFDLRLATDPDEYLVVAVATGPCNLRPASAEVQWECPMLVMPAGVCIGGSARRVGVEPIPGAVIQATRTDCPELLLNAKKTASSRERVERADRQVFLSLGVFTLLWRRNGVELALTQAITNDEGHFCLDGLLSTDYEVTLRKLPDLDVHPSLARALARVAGAPTEHVDLDVQYGVVDIEVSRHDVPVAGAKVRLDGEQDNCTRYTDTHGAMIIAMAQDLRLSLFVGRRSAIDYRDVILTPGNDQRQTYRVRLP
jgi:RNA polymerase sigma-70 factor (ECF subfamily)